MRRWENCTTVWLESVKKESLRRPRRRWKDNIKMDVKEICRVVIGLIWIRQKPVAGFFEDGNEPSDSTI
jgi:hypothetical protein